MRHLVRDVSRVLTLFLASRQAWPEILWGDVLMFWGKFPPKRSPDKTLCITAPIVVDFNRTLRPSIGLALVVVGVNVSLVLVDELYADPTSHGVPF